MAQFSFAEVSFLVALCRTHKFRSRSTSLIAIGKSRFRQVRLSSSSCIYRDQPRRSSYGPKNVQIENNKGLCVGLCFRLCEHTV